MRLSWRGSGIKGKELCWNILKQFGILLEKRQLRKIKHNAEAEAISLGKQKGKNIENKKEIGLSMGSTSFRGKVGYRSWEEDTGKDEVWLVNGGNVWRLSSDCFYFSMKYVTVMSIMSEEKKVG